MMQKESTYCKEVDMPINQERIIEFNQVETNAFNKIRYLSVCQIKLESPVKIGVLRLYFSCPQGGNSPTRVQMQHAHHIA